MPHAPDPHPPRSATAPSPPRRLPSLAATTRAVLLVLHGGKADSLAPSRPWHLSAVRMVPFARRLHDELGPQGVAVWSVRYRHRGWNGALESPVADARAALDLVRAEHGLAPVVLLGHSMGGRAALRVADDPSVRGVTALAPWLPDGEPVRVAGTVVHLSHGTRDRWTDPRATARWARRAEPVAHRLTLVPVPGAGHFLFRDARRWHALARAGVVDGLVHALGRTSAPSTDPTGAPTAPKG